MLYFDTRLCLGQDVSCASCHDLARAGVDGEVQSTGTKQQRGKRNTPTVLNAGGSFAQGWDARATTIEEFVLPHMTDPVIMGMDEKRVVDTIESVPPTRLRSGRCSPTISPPFRVSGETVGRALDVRRSSSRGPAGTTTSQETRRR